MKTNLEIPLAAALAGLVSLSGCSLLIKAAKGEIAPIGVTQASSGDIRSLASVVTSSDDPAAFTKAFGELTSIYLYKCLDNPTMAPREGKSEIREQAGASLLAAMRERVAKHDLGADPALGTAASDVAAFEGKVQAKCDAGKLGNLDPGGHLAKAVRLAQPDGRDAYVEETAQALDGELEASIADDRAVSKWATSTCGQLLPVWSYCVPRAVEVYYARGQWDSIVSVFLSGSEEQAAQVLPALARKVGTEQVVKDARTYLLNGSQPLPAAPSALDVMAGFLRDNGAWGSCDDRQDLLQRSLHGEATQLARWAITMIVEDQCHNLDADLIKALGSDMPWVRQKAAWATGELGIQKAKKHVERLRYSDPYLDEGCWCHPVRDAASNAYNKLELQNG